MNRLILTLALIGVLLVSGCVQQAGILQTSNELPCSTLPECKDFVKSTGLSDEQTNQAMERIQCANNRCYRR